MQSCYGLRPDQEFIERKSKYNLLLVTANMNLLYSIGKIIKSEIIAKQVNYQNVISEIQAKEKEFEVKRIEYEEQIEYLESTLETLQGNMYKWMNEASEANKKLKKARELIEEMKVSHAEEVKRMTEEQEG